MTDVPTTNAEFVDQLNASGGELRIEQPSGSERAAWRRALHALVNSTDVPPGFRVRFSGRDRGPLTIRLVPEDADAAVREYPTVPVPQRLVRPHPMLVATRDACKQVHEGWADTRRTSGVLHLRVAQRSVTRVLLLAQAMADEAARRGWVVGPVKGYRCEGGFGVTIDGHAFELAFSEESDRARHVATKAEIAAAERSSWVRIPDWDYTPSGRLVMRIGHDGYKNTTLATDRQRWRIEDRLGRAIELLESAAAEELRKAAEREREREVRAAQWRAAMDRARRLHWESVRAARARELVGRWRVSADLRAMADAVRSNGHADVDRDWLAWVENYAAELDPVANFRPPELAEPEPEDLRPYLGKWSPFGPERGVW